MHLRRERTHQTGKSNKDYKAEQNQSQNQNDLLKDNNTQTRLDSLSRPKVRNFSEVIRQKMNKNAVLPMTNTQIFYKEHGKKMKHKAQIGYPREAHLEEKEKMKIAFTGESDLIYKANYCFLDEESNPHTEILAKAQDKESLIQEKHKEHSLALQETQLVAMEKYRQNTLKDKIDLDKVREIRRAIRRRYGNRGNMRKIFNLWDEDHLGVITVKNIYNMAKKLGLNMNFDEARVLLASADKDFSGDLAVDEFLDLIYNKDDILNVNLDKLAANIDENLQLQKEEIERSNILNTLSQDAKNARESRHRNQINLILKNRLKDMATYFLEIDLSRLGYMNYGKFEQSIRKLGINENILKEQDIHFLFDKYKTDEHNTNYRQLIDDLKEFKFVQEEIYRDELGSARAIQKLDPSRIKLISDTQSIPNENLPILDCRTLHIDMLEKCFKRSRKVTRALKRYFPTEKEFTEHMMKTLKVESDKIEKHLISKDILKTSIENLFKSFDDPHLTAKDLQGFYSTLIYNQQGFTDFKEIVHTIFEEDEKDFIKKVQMKAKGPTPIEGISVLNISNGNIAELNQDNPIQSNKELPTSDLSARATATEGRTKSSGDIYSAPNLRNNFMINDKNLNSILNRLENKLFVGKTKAYNVYKMFDTDKDGYVSKNDFIKKISDMHILEKDEITTLVQHVDLENKGYINFNEFSKKLRPNMTQQDENGNQIILPYVAPSEALNTNLQKEMGTIKNKIQDYKKPFTANPSTDLKGATRFGASPGWKNTFLSMQAPSNSAMFITEEDRFSKNREQFQQEERIRKEAAQQARIERIKMHQNFFETKINEQTEMNETRELAKQKMKYLAQSVYEHVSFLL